ncbi:MAG TPA: hypothetical protein VFO89_03360, partial [Thermoanaerobaculia bacterium]|nr:hypothetical protein [Thermoanaerobaculia bacterium]
YVHFSGHGAGDDGIVFEGGLVSGEALADLFRIFSDTIRCVVLNACYSAIQARQIAQHIDYVIGMSKKIGDAAAIEFSVAFYDAVGAGESIPFAFDLARNAILLAGLPEHLTPQLLTRNGETVAEVDVPGVRPAQKATCRDWDGAPAVSVLYGREAVAEMLRSWILEDFCRVVLITGMGGIGKTDLATGLGRGGIQNADPAQTLAGGIQGHFECVLWRTLLNAPPPEVLFADIAGILSGHKRPARLSSSEQLEEILRSFQERRCLVILDNVETVLQPGDPAMRYREGYERYGAFFELVAKTSHQSCLLLTSREKPRAIANLEGAKRPVRSNSLSGIGPTESRSLFAQISTFAGNADDWSEIARLYGGNPLALELVARHVDQIYGGDLAAFLASSHHLFTDIEELLDWHVDRLTDAESELLYWLAIEREPVTLATLYDDLVSPVSRERIASTLQILQRRIPLERVAIHHFALQPVLIEHVTKRLVHRIAAALTAAIAEALRSDGHARVPESVIEAVRLLNDHALVKATAAEHVRDSQQRLILGPIAEQLTSACAQRDVRPGLEAMLNAWRRENASEPGYAAGNVLNLLAHAGIDLHGFDASRLRVWQATLHDVTLHDTNFSFADFRHCTLRHAFGTAFVVEYTPDGTLIAVGDDNGDVRLFHALTGELHRRFVGHADTVFTIAFSSDGRTMASAGFDNTIRLWTVADGRCIDILLGHEGWVYSVRFSPDGRTLASASEDGTCRLWDLPSGACTIVPMEEPGFVASVAFSPDGALLAAGGSAGVVTLFPIADLTRPMRLFGHTRRIRSITFSRQGDLLASGGEDGRVLLWRPHDGAHLAILSAHTGAVMSLSFSDKGDLLASASDDQTVRLWDTGRHACVGRLHASESRVWSVACSPAGRTLVMAGEDSAIRVWNIDPPPRLLMTLRGYSNKIWSLAFLPDRSRLVAGSEDSVVRVWDTDDGVLKAELRQHASRIWAVAASPDGRWIASASDDSTIRLWDVESRICRHVMRGHSDWIRTLAFDPHAELLASGAEDGRVNVWATATGARLRTIDSRLARVFAVAFCGDGTTIAAGGSESEIRLLAADDSVERGALRGHSGWISALVPIGPRHLASCSEDGSIRLWDLDSGECRMTLPVGSKVWCAASGGGGSWLVSGSADGFLRRWSIENGECVASIRAHQDAIWSLGIDAREETVATTGDDGAIRLWRLPDLAPCSVPNTLRSPRPYEGMNITGATGLTLEQKNAMVALGAIEMPSR